MRIGIRLVGAVAGAAIVAMVATMALGGGGWRGGQARPPRRFVDGPGW